MKRGESPLPRTVLLVDDDPISLEIIALLLTADGHQVLQASSGVYAMALLHSSSGGETGSAAQAAFDTAIPEGERPDVVMVDMQMPGISGHDLRRYIASLPAPRPRVIGISATALPEEQTALFDHFLLKPLEPAVLRAAIQGCAREDLAYETCAGGFSESDRPAGGHALDREVLHKLQAILPPEAIREIYSTYVSDTRERIAEMERCSLLGDTEGLRRCAHMIKGSAAMAGVSGIFGIASSFEAGTVARENHQSLFHHLRIACDDVERLIAYNAPERPR